VEQSLPLLLSGAGQRGELETVEHLVADGHGIVDLLQEETVLLHAGRACDVRRSEQHTGIRMCESLQRRKLETPDSTEGVVDGANSNDQLVV
jgi:hypothetical protein